MRKTTKILSLILNILCWVMLIGSLFYGISAAVGWFSSDASGEAFVSGITLDNLQFYSSTGGISISNQAMKNMQLVTLLVYFVQVPLMCWGIQILRMILHPITQERPFSGTSSLLKKLGWVCILIAAVENLADWGMHSVMEHQYHMANFFLGSVITDVRFLFELDYTFLLVALVVFILSGVFSHGEQLQQLSDETL